MSKLLVVEKPMMVVWAYPERKLIHHVMKTYCHGTDFREGLSKGADALKLHKATKWLSDDRAGGAAPMDDEEWAQKVWLPRVINLGWKHWAMVPPAKVIGRIKLERIVKQFAALGINARPFSDPDEAMAWLEEQ